ncbi:hypothetical protein C1Y63_04920 [Corynebacterium sp. 13CS0277]|uniref:hypothetical protein n=1 Tax=Corynebacterium sp. 13CS0277 TaxID=2071994 RepID=UPI000D02A419|nr:hypothetical protein [Corynebacterium sp. 13CS0277]PRQ11754.1 hypothetical protein C1Y63_04920 [Corynebacterium sp. 13CS0277]
MYTDPPPVAFHPDALAAMDACTGCPALARCAAQALHAGTSLDGRTTAPAAGVIQAGVYCTGDADTAAQLAAIAGTPAPRYQRHRPRPTIPHHCQGCHKPLHPWTRNPEQIPEGHVMHYARGYCTGCRARYRRAKRTTT